MSAYPKVENEEAEHCFFMNSIVIGKSSSLINYKVNSFCLHIIA